MEGDCCCKLPSTTAPVFIVRSVFFMSLFPMILSLFWPRSTIVISATINDRYFGHDQRLLFPWQSDQLRSASIKLIIFTSTLYSAQADHPSWTTLCERTLREFSSTNNVNMFFHHPYGNIYHKCVYAKYYIDRQLGSIHDHVLFSPRWNNVTLITFLPLFLMKNINKLLVWSSKRFGFCI